MHNTDPKVTFQHYKETITKKVTDLIAASILASKDFANKDKYPRFFPLPFNNFGHYFLFDYNRFLLILNEFIDELNALPKRKINPKIENYGLLFSILLFFYFLFTYRIITSILILVVIITAIYLLQKYLNVSKACATHRVDLINQLLEGSWEPYEDKYDEIITKNSSRVGDGSIDGEQVPVLVIFNDIHPFPGYGQLQIDRVYLCQPKEGQSHEENIDQQFLNNLVEILNQKMEISGLDNFNSGFVVGIHAKSIEANSQWLIEESRPILFIDKDKIMNSNGLDGSARLFLTIQTILPQFMTAISFFTRVYKVGNSLACQISITTLGPPVQGTIDILKQLDTYQNEMKKNEKSSFLDSLNSKNITKTIPTIFTRIAKAFKAKEPKAIGETLLSNYYYNNNSFLGYVGYKEIEELKTLASEALQESGRYQKEYEKLDQNTSIWPGQHYEVKNYREDHSLTFTNDYFGRPEGLGQTTVLYEQLSKSILDLFDETGFDISEYKDKEGNYLINAEKIEQLVIGEKITMNTSNRKGKQEVVSNNPIKVNAQD
ncbi:MAG: hypothetical protein ACPGJS_04880 [Flammeovirgaceae bacterium]